MGDGDWAEGRSWEDVEIFISCDGFCLCDLDMVLTEIDYRKPSEAHKM